MLQLKKTINNDIISDEEIIEEIKKGDKDLFRIIMKRYNQRLYRTAVSFGIDDDSCDDILQQSYINAFYKIEQFNGDAKFSTWLTRIVINECLMFKRREKQNFRNHEKFNSAENVTYLNGSHQTPDNEYMNRETKNIIEEAVSKLPLKYKAVFILREVEGLSTKETSDSLGISEMNVKIRLHRGKSLLQKYLLSKFNYNELFTFGNKRCDLLTESVMKRISS